MIHQALHGYSDGHGLLAASRTLSREQRALLGQMTDLSGPSPVSGFDGYLSGFPLPGAIYVLARTWYAHELPRPGCVWTHSLLLTEDELEETHVLSLAEMLRRPSPEAGFSDYTAALNLPEEQVTKPPQSVTALASILEPIYALPSIRVCVVADTASDLELPFLAVWHQQWMRLRTAFSFTTAMLGNGSRPFDLQGVPSRNQIFFASSAGFTVVGALGDIETRDDWVRTAAENAVRWENHAGLGAFLRAFGNDFSRGRAAFRGLCETYTATRESSKEQQALNVQSHVDAFFRDAPEAGQLRNALFGGNGPWAVDELGSLALLAQDDSGRILEESAARLRERASALPLPDLEALVLRLPYTNPSHRLKAILDTFATRCLPERAATLPTELLTVLLRERPDLARPDTFWRGVSEPLALVKALLSNKSFAPATGYGLLGFADRSVLREADEAPREVWVRAIREFTDEKEPAAEVERFVLDRLASSQSELRFELNATAFGCFLKYAAVALDVSAREAALFPIHNARDCDLPQLIDEAAEIRASCFLLIVGLHRTEMVAAQFMASGLPSVYAAAKEGRLSGELWRNLEPLLPWHWLGWDRCLRLVEGSVLRFVERSWPPTAFFKTFSSDEQFERALSALHSTGGDEYLARLRSESTASLSEFQRKKLGIADT